MSKIITMDQCLATTEQMQKMTENKGVQIDVTFFVSESDLYGISKMMKLEVIGTSKVFSEDNMVAYWYPNGDTDSLTVTFISQQK